MHTAFQHFASLVSAFRLIARGGKQLAWLASSSYRASVSHRQADLPRHLNFFLVIFH